MNLHAFGAFVVMVLVVGFMFVRFTRRQEPMPLPRPTGNGRSRTTPPNRR